SKEESTSSSIAWLNIPEIIATIRNTLKMLKYFGYKKASNQHLTEEELQYLNFLENQFKETRDSKRVIKNLENLEVIIQYM
ncbi:22101_t:CDS:1, partial [Gigaspora margarita]